MWKLNYGNYYIVNIAKNTFKISWLLRNLGASNGREYYLAMCTYAIGNASWKNGFDDDAGATSADDAESKTAAIVDEIYHFNLSPFRIQLRTKKDFKVPPFVMKL